MSQKIPFKVCNLKIINEELLLKLLLSFFFYVGTQCSPSIMERILSGYRKLRSRLSPDQSCEKGKYIIRTQRDLKVTTTKLL